MFTGLVEEIGSVISIKKNKNVATLEIKCSKILEDAKIGDSISVNGACLTVIFVKDKSLGFNVMEETFKKTNLNYLKKDSLVNLERALLIHSRLGGHFVTGHVDGISKIIENKISGKSWVLEIAAPKDLSGYIAQKGSIAINGVSLTVGKTNKTSFIIYLIPYTLDSTNLKNLRKNDFVNVETDLLAKYSLNYKNLESKVSIDFLKSHGFI